MMGRGFGIMVVSVLTALTASACAADATRSEPLGSGSSELSGCVPDTLTGIDVSYHNDVVDWAKVKASGRAFAFARVSDGLTDIDTQFAKNWPAIKAAGLTRGVYQFFRARHTGASQADVMLEQLAAAGGLKAGDLPPVLDLETKDGQTTANVVTRAKDWLTRVESKIGVKPIVYTGNNMSSTIGTNFEDYVLWVAHYEVECPRIPAGWTTWTFWQDAEDGSCPGVTSGGVDTDFFQGQAADLAAITMQHSVTIPRSAIVPAPELEEAVSVGGAVMGDGVRGLVDD
jgi:lysozyme